MWQKLKRLFERGEHSKFIWEILGWLGWDRPFKAIFIWLSTGLGGLLAMLGHLPAYMIGIVALGFFALTGVGANAWEDWQAKREQKKAILKSDIRLKLLGAFHEIGLIDADDGHQLPHTIGFNVRVTNEGDKFLEKCQLTFGEKDAFSTYSLSVRPKTY